MGKAIIALVILLAIAILVILGLGIGLIPWQSKVSPVVNTPFSPIPPASIPAPPVTPSTQSPLPATSIPPSLQPPSPTPVVTPSPKGTADFTMAVTDISGTGFSRAVTAQITNTGNADAHNVWGKVEVLSQSSLIKLDGKESLRVDIGTITAGGTVTSKVTLNFGLTDSLKILKSGATFKLTIYSDEVTKTFSYDYSP